MSRATNIAKHYARIASQWPKDPMRPQGSFVKVAEWREKHATEPSGGGVDAQVELRNVNALYSLLDNRYKKKYPLPPQVLTPASNPHHYTDLIAELEAAPNRNWWQNFVASLKGKIRFS